MSHSDGLGSPYNDVELILYLPQTPSEWDKWRANRQRARDRIRSMCPKDGEEIIAMLGLTTDRWGVEIAA